MAKVRVYELARELNEDNRSLEKVIRNLGIPIKNYMSTLTPEEASRVRATVKGVPEAAAAPATTQERVIAGGNKTAGTKKRGGTVIRRRGADVRRRRAERAEAEEAAKVETPQPAARPVTRRPEARPAASSSPTPRSQPTRRTVPARPAESRPASAAPVRRQSAAAAPAPVEAKAPVEAEVEAEAPKRAPQVGERIALPSNTRRLPGGMASRLEARGPAERPAPAPEPAAEAPAPKPAEAAPAPEPEPADAPASPAAATKADEAAAPVEAAAEGTAAAADSGGRRVVRNEDGVIVGAASQRSEPKILGFIQIPQNRRKQQVIITDANEQEKMGRASQRKQREERHQARGRRKPPRRGGRHAGPSGPPKINTVEMSDEKKRIRVDEAIQVADLAHQMGKKASAILRTLWGMGMRGITINNAIDYETAEMVAAEFGYTAENVAFDEAGLIAGSEEIETEPRAPVVTVMGHVDHGKTSLLDYIRNSRVAAGEAGGITQHVAAYKVSTAKGEVTFLDTPGHEAFTAMRSRGAQITDIVVLVVAADDGVMPTTIEAIKHSKEAGVPIVVAVNKIDKPEANSGRVKQALMEHELVGEEFGGAVPIVEVSAKTGQGVEDLLETLVLQAELLELHAPSDGKATGTVLEARIDKGRGTVATVLVQSGTLNKGDIVVANEYHAKVRGLINQQGKMQKSAGPSTPIEVLGLSGVPLAGDTINVVDNDKDAKALVAHRREKRLRKESVRSGPSITELMLRKKVPVLKIVLKADVQGSAQALAEALEEITNETEKVKLEVIKAEVGQINETDVKYAHAGEAVIFGFNVKTAGKAAPVAEHEGVAIHTFSVIYNALDLARELMIGLLEPEYREREQGEAEVRALFPIPRLGVVAGCRVTRGLITRSSHVRVLRDGEVLHSGMIGSLRVHKDDVKEVKDGFECGIVVDGFTELAEGDQLQAFEMEAIPPTL
ncbi:MAG: translation initiation factor IF-2 [Myxococcota bacterium]